MARVCPAFVQHLSVKKDQKDQAATSVFSHQLNKSRAAEVGVRSGETVERIHPTARHTKANAKPTTLGSLGLRDQ